MLRYTVGRDDKVLGEFTGEQIKDQVRSGELLESDLVYTEGFDDWKPIGEVPELQDVEAHPSPMSDTPSWKKVIGCSVLFAILTFWFSEAVFRPAPPLILMSLVEDGKVGSKSSAETVTGVLAMAVEAIRLIM